MTPRYIPHDRKIQIAVPRHTECNQSTIDHDDIHPGRRPPTFPAVRPALPFRFKCPVLKVYSGSNPYTDNQARELAGTLEIKNEIVD